MIMMTVGNYTANIYKPTLYFHAAHWVKFHRLLVKSILYMVLYCKHFS